MRCWEGADQCPWFNSARAVVAWKLAVLCSCCLQPVDTELSSLDRSSAFMYAAAELCQHLSATLAVVVLLVLVLTCQVPGSTKPCM